MRHTLILLFTFTFTFTLFISGCNQADKEQAVVTPKPAPSLKLTEFNHQAWLRAELPEQALFYLRVPNVWFLFTGLDNGFKYAQGNEQHVNQLKLIQESLYDNLLSKMEPTTKPLAELLAKHMAAPLELAVLNNPEMPNMPGVILATKLNIKTTAEFSDLLKSLTLKQPMLQLSQQSEKNDQGLLTIAPMNINVLYQFDEKTGRLTFVASMAADKTKLETQLALIKPIQAHPMYATEQKIDDSGKGLFGFINAKTIIPVAQKILGPEMTAGLKVSGMDQLNTLAFGYGSSNQKTRLKVLLDMPVVGFRAFLPTANNQLAISARGQVNAVAVLSLPTEVQFKRIESAVIMMNGASPEYNKSKAEFKDATGFSVEQILSMIGPEIVYFSDDISDFLAVRNADPKLLSELISSAVDKGWIEYNEHQKDGLTIKHISSKSMPFEEFTQEIKQNSPVLGEMMANMKSHYFWVEEDGYLIYSAIPQPLIERHQHKNSVSIKDWLTHTQKQDLTSAFIGYTSAQLNLSRTSYHIYLQVLHMLADMSGAEIDIFALPHAGDLGFADKGTIGFNLDFDQNYLALEFNFEQSLFDGFYGGSYQTVAAIGILAAIAIPAYQDYVTRAQVESISAATSLIRAEITQQLQSGVSVNKASISEELKAQAIANVPNLIESITIEQAQIIVSFAANNETKSLSGGDLTLIPTYNKQSGSVKWRCKSQSLTTKQLPSICGN